MKMFNPNKQVVVVLSGRSASQILENLDELRRKNVFLVGVNHYAFYRDNFVANGIRLDALIAFSQESTTEDFTGYILKDSAKRGCSLFEFLCQCMDCGIREVFLFGADGYSETPFEFIDGYPHPHSQEQHRESHKVDTDHINARWNHYNKRTAIYNCNPESKYRVFPKLSFEEGMKKLKDKHWLQ